VVDFIQIRLEAGIALLSIRTRRGR